MLDLSHTDGYAVGGFIMAAAVGGYRQLKKYGIAWDKIRVKAAVLLLLVLQYRFRFPFRVV